MSKKLEEMTFEELVTACSQIELEALIRGEGSIHGRVWRICELAVRWRVLQTEEAERKKSESVEELKSRLHKDTPN